MNRDAMFDEAANFIVAQAKTLAGFVWDDGNFFNPAYLFCTALIALSIWLSNGRPKPLKDFLFPSDVYSHSSTQTDWRLSTFNIAFVGLGLVSLTDVSSVVSRAISRPADQPLSIWSVVVISLTLILVADLGRYIGHRLHHEASAFWPFHAVHHSAEVLTPLTSWRVHPVYFLTNTIILSILLGIAVGFTQYLGKLEGIIFVGQAVIISVYFIIGAHLRHSHIWVSYPAWLEHLLISPAQHQIHHSKAVAHRDKNFGEIFAIWDWMFGTLYVTRGREELEFGLVGEREGDVYQPYPTFWSALRVPFAEFFDCASKPLARLRPL